MEKECLRVVVNRWDDTYIYAKVCGDGNAEVQVHYCAPSPYTAYKNCDWKYLSAVLRENCLLNLVHPIVREGVLYPELIIFEPDYLVDISAIAACFERFSHSSLIYLLNKLKPAANTSATLLGNLASQLFDDALYAYPDNSSYKESVQTFFKRHALDLLAAEVNADFHAKARDQQDNIRYIIRHTLPEMFQNDGMGAFDPSEIIVEPSFFSEMLGLQGRMDFLQKDLRMLIEQKSGKAAYPEQNPPHPQLKHSVQLLLYSMILRYNHQGQYENNGGHIHSLLLYSKYREGLVGQCFSPDLAFEALRVRNEIVAREFSYAGGGIRVLETLTADSLNTNHLTGVLWERYQKPQIETLLAPIQRASALERAYYFRFMQFLEREHLMAKVGSQTKDNYGFADKWNSSLEEKQMAGNILCGLQLEDNDSPSTTNHQPPLPASGDLQSQNSPSSSNPSRVEQVRLNVPTETEATNFRKGDIVVLYPYAEGTEPDVRQTLVFRSTIVSIEDNGIVLNLRDPQPSRLCSLLKKRRGAPPSARMLWAIEHDFFETSFNALYRAMHTFLSAPQERKDLLLLQRPPQIDTSLTLKGDYGEFNELALKVKRARDLFLIIGPPGTGKTTYGLMTTLQEELRTNAYHPSSVLLMAYTNRAVDEICGKLVEQGIGFVRLGGRFSCDEAYRPWLLEIKAQQCRNLQELQTLVQSTRVFVATTTALNGNPSIFRFKSFSLAIIDEASQILEPHLVGLLGAQAPDGSCAIRKFVLIGDHKQLSAVVLQPEEESRVDDPHLGQCDSQSPHLTNCRHSLFERLLRQYRNNPDVVYMLTHQGRMHPDIAAFPNQAFYQGLLSAVPLPHQQEQQAAFPRFAFIAVPRISNNKSVSPLQEGNLQEEQLENTGSVNSNPAEAQAIAAAVWSIYEYHRLHPCPSEEFPASPDVGIIVPYRNQISEVRKAIAGQFGVHPCSSDACSLFLKNITIDTVERFQGSQRDYILYGFTVSHPQQLPFLTENTFRDDEMSPLSEGEQSPARGEGVLIDRKLNVAMTRARRHLFLFGDPDILSRASVFRQLIDYTKLHHCYFSSSPFCGSNFFV